MPPPRGGGALLRNLSDKNTLSSAFSQGPQAGQQAGQNASGAATKAELDANILAGGGLGLDPENDPIVATTDWGLDIYFHNAGEGTWKNTTADGSVSTAALSGYNYFLGGTYGGVALKWVIIGYSTNTVSAGPVKPNNVSNSNVFPDTTDAGSVIKTYGSRGLIYVNSYKLSAYTNAVGTTEIPAGCVLCISEKNLLNADYNSTYYSDDGDGYYKGGRWVHSELRTTMSNLCNSGITGFDTIRAKIQTVSLNTYSWKYKMSDETKGIGKDTSSDKFFALANSTYNTDDQVVYNTSTYPQNYRLETYLGATYASHASKRISYTHNKTTADSWWLRSGYSSSASKVYCVYARGCIDYTSASASLGVRPAFVLNVWS